MNHIWHRRKNVVRKHGRISSKYHQLVEKCNSLHLSISCVTQQIDFDYMIKQTWVGLAAFIK